MNIHRQKHIKVYQLLDNRTLQPIHTTKTLKQCENYRFNTMRTSYPIIETILTLED